MDYQYSHGGVDPPNWSVSEAEAKELAHSFAFLRCPHPWDDDILAAFEARLLAEMKEQGFTIVGVPTTVRK